MTPNNIDSYNKEDNIASEDASQNSNSKEYDPKARDICRWFYDQLSDQEKKKVKGSVKTEWLKTVEQCNRIDGISYEDLLKAVKWARNDQFWGKQFRSITKLRKKGKDQLLNFAQRWLELSSEPKQQKQVYNYKPKTKQDYD